MHFQYMRLPFFPSEITLGWKIDTQTKGRKSLNVFLSDSCCLFPLKCVSVADHSQTHSSVNLVHKLNSLKCCWRNRITQQIKCVFMGWNKQFTIGGRNRRRWGSIYCCFVREMKKRITTTERGEQQFWFQAFHQTKKMELGEAIERMLLFFVWIENIKQ